MWYIKVNTNSSKNPIPLSRFAQKLHLAMPSISLKLMTLMAQTDILNEANITKDLLNKTNTPIY